jgi:ATP-dependent DNA helicase RecG
VTAESDEPNPRVAALVASDDGFELAEVDLELRGEGTLMGGVQKGRNDLKLASLRRDRHLVQLARDAAFTIVGDDPAMAAFPDLVDELDLLMPTDGEEFLFKS